jgi:endonuclease YncB( thermonuclease family)
VISSRNLLLVSLIALTIAPIPARAEDRPASPAECTLEPGEDRTVTQVVDGETLAVDGGTHVRLIGALAPRPYDTAGDTSHWPLAEQSRNALEQLVAGRGVRLAFAGRRTDRHGRLLAHVFVGGDADRTWVQGEMLKRGLARAYGLEGSTQCLTELIAHEAIARRTGAGLWAETIYAVRTADDIATLQRLAGTFQIVEGRVVAVSSMRGSTYVNFGTDWRQDFTVLIRSAGKHVPAEMLSDALPGQRIRVRGWVERRGGPMIAINHPAEIELLHDEKAVKPTDRRTRRRTDTPE